MLTRVTAATRHVGLCLVVLLTCVALSACSPPPSVPPPATSTVALPAQTQTLPPPPRPTAAPPALSPLSSPVASPGAAVAATARPSPRVRLGLVDTLSEIGLRIGLQRGYYAEQGLDVQIEHFSSQAAMVAGLIAGQVDAATLSINADLFTLLSRDAGLKIVAEATGAPRGHGAAGLIVRSGLTERLKTPTDLRSMRIALPNRGDSLDVELGALLKQGWLARGDVEGLVLPAAAAAAGLAEGSLDAAMLPEPSLSELEQQGLGTVWRRSDEIVPNHLTAVLVFNGRFSVKQPDAARRFVTAYLKSLRLYNDVFVKRQQMNRGELIQILGPLTSTTDPSRLERMVLPGINPNGMVNIQTLLLDQQFFLTTSLQQKEIDLSSVVDAQYAAYAINQLGEYR